MKLIHYTFRNLSIPLLIILTAWACCFYFVIMHEIDDETNDSLENYKEIIIKSVLADSTLLRDHVDIMTKYYIREVPEAEADFLLIIRFAYVILFINLYALRIYLRR